MPRAREPSSDTRMDARAKMRSPVRIATELPHTSWAVGAPRRNGAESITSSWYSVARCVSSTTTAAWTTSGREASPRWAHSRVSSGRMRFPPASTRWRDVASANGSELEMASRSFFSTRARLVVMAGPSSGSPAMAANPAGSWSPVAIAVVLGAGSTACGKPCPACVQLCSAEFVTG